MNQERNQHGRGNGNNNGGNGRGVKGVFAITERGEKSYWTRIGVAYLNRDGSITCRLEALPVSGTLQIREEGRDRDDADDRDR